jgi:HlyD family type I secretion membrane fusion protein
VSVSDIALSNMDAVPVSTRFETRLFYAVAAGFFGIFLGWGFLAQLNAGAIASGEVIPAGRVKTIQHLEGGIVEAILVSEGDSVKAGSELMRFDDTEARAQLGIAEAERASQEALIARLESERDGFPYRPAAEAAASPSVMAQVRLFDSRQEALDKEVAGLSARLASIRKELQGWEGKGRALVDLRANAEEESKMNQRLYEQKFISRPRLLQLESQRADSAARQSENAAEIARARQRIADTGVAIAKLKNDRMSGLLEELRRAQDAASTARQRAAVARDRLARTHVVAPQDGFVNGLKYTTVGGVVPPGGAIVDIVPTTEQLVVEARVLADDIDVVEAGRVARVRLTAYKARSHISLNGKVVQVSSNTFRDERAPGPPYYKARIEIGPDELRKVERGLLVPGMLAQVEIDAGQRSAIAYLFDPVLNSMTRAFKES